VTINTSQNTHNRVAEIHKDSPTDGRILNTKNLHHETLITRTTVKQHKFCPQTNNSRTHPTINHKNQHNLNHTIQPDQSRTHAQPDHHTRTTGPPHTHNLTSPHHTNRTRLKATNPNRFTTN